MAFKMEMGRRTFLKGTAAASALAALAGCGKKGGAEAAASEGGKLTVYINNPVAIDPYNLQETEGTQVGFQLFDALTSYDFEKGELVPCAAKSWEANDTADEFTFHLVEGAKFHNGDTVDAAAFKRGWERIVNPQTNPDSPSVISYHLAMVDGYDALESGEAKELTGVTCPDENTLVVKLTAPYADFPYVCSHPALGPVPKAALDDFQTFFTAPIGNGAFMMDGKWEDGQYINLKRFDDYYGERAKVGTVNFTIQKDLETAYREFQAGNIDIADVPTAQLKDAQDTYGVAEDGYTIKPGQQMCLGAEPSTYYLTVNVKDETMGDKDLRHAISLAINRQNICDTVYKGTREPAGNVVPPGIAGYEENAWTDSHYDKEAAEAILDTKWPKDANGNRPLSLKLSSNVDGGHKDVMECVMADLKKVGVNCELDQGEWAAILNKYQNGEYQFGRLGWVADYPIMDNFLYSLFYTGNGDNRSQYSDPEVDDELTKARQTVDDDERIRLMQEVNKKIGDDMPVIPLMFYKHTTVGGERIKSCYIDPQKKYHLAKAELV